MGKKMDIHEFPDVYKNAAIWNENELYCGNCSSTRVGARLFLVPEEEKSWIQVYCKKCGAILFYNGA